MTGILFNELVHRCQPSLERLAFRYIHDEDAARDIVQDSFLRFRSALTDRNPDNPYAYLFRITRNRCVDFLRRRRRESRLTDTLSAEAAARTDMSDDDASLRMAVHAGLDRLSDKLRLPLEMAEFDKMPYTEIAETLNIPVNTVRTRIYRAREKLLTIFKQMGVRL